MHILKYCKKETEAGSKWRLLATRPLAESVYWGLAINRAQGQPVCSLPLLVYLFKHKAEMGQSNPRSHFHVTGSHNPGVEHMLRMQVQHPTSPVKKFLSWFERP